MNEADQALLIAPTATSRGERERRRLLRALGDRQATAVARLDQIQARQHEILAENGLLDDSSDEPS